MLHTKVTKDFGPSSKEPARKRVARACDRCRLKKGKCDGKEQCAKCVSADVMCIYTDRKPPQHKLISPAVAEALQSENLTLKKAAIVIFKQLMDAQNGNLPIIDGVDWSSDKVASGKSGRALNYIISQQARVDNRISNEEITNYESDSQMLDSTSSRNGPDSPSSRQSSPQSTAGDTGSYWNGGFEITQEQYNHVQHKKRKSLKYDYPGSSDASSIQAISSGAFIDPNVLQSIGSTFNNPPTPPTALDGMDYLPPGQLQWPNQQQQPTRFYEDERYTLQRYSEAAQSVRGPAGEVPCDSGSMPWGAVGPEFYQYMAEKEYGKVYEPIAGDAQMYDRV